MGSFSFSSVFRLGICPTSNNISAKGSLVVVLLVVIDTKDDFFDRTKEEGLMIPIRWFLGPLKQAVLFKSIKIQKGKVLERAEKWDRTCWAVSRRNFLCKRESPTQKIDIDGNSFIWGFSLLLQRLLKMVNKS